MKLALYRCLTCPVLRCQPHGAVGESEMGNIQRYRFMHMTFVIRPRFYEMKKKRNNYRKHLRASSTYPKKRRPFLSRADRRPTKVANFPQCCLRLYQCHPLPPSFFSLVCNILVWLVGRHCLRLISRPGTCSWKEEIMTDNRVQHARHGCSSLLGEEQPPHSG